MGKVSTDKPRAKGDIRSEISKRKDEIRKKNDEGEVVVKDKKQVADTAGNLRVSGTVEGANAAKQAMEGAASAADQGFGKKKADAEKTYGEAKETEGEMGTRADSAKQDSQAADRAASSVKTGDVKGRLQDASKAAKQDASDLEGEKKRQEGDRREGEKKTEHQDKEIRSTKVKFRN